MVNAVCVVIMGIESVEEDNIALKFILVGGGLLLRVMSALAFGFAVVAWRKIGVFEKKIRGGMN